MRLISASVLKMPVILVLLDVALLVVLWPLSLGVLDRVSAQPDGADLTAGVLFPLAQIVLLYALGMYRRENLLNTRQAMTRMPLVAALGAVGGSVLVGLVAWQSGTVAPAGLGGRTIAAYVCFLVCGLAARVVVAMMFRRGMIRRRVLVAGAGRRAWDLAWLLRAEGKNLSYQINFFHDPSYDELDPRLADGAQGRVIHAGASDLLLAARALAADQIVVAPDERRGMDLGKLLACKTSGYPVQEYLSFIEMETRRIDLKRLDIGWLVYGEGFYLGLVDRILKRMLDVVISLLLLVPALPLILLGVILIKLDDGGPVLYRQTRITRGNRPFEILKLRTMTVNAEAGGAVWAASGDARITRVGNFLRRSRIDELPQLFSILRGDMSFVGPRPERPGFVSMLEEAIPLYGERHRVKAGLTGWAQVNYPYGASVDDARSKLSYDLYYVKNFSILFDVLIVLQTMRVVLFPGNSVR